MALLLRVYFAAGVFGCIVLISKLSCYVAQVLVLFVLTQKTQKVKTLKTR